MSANVSRGAMGSGNGIFVDVPRLKLLTLLSSSRLPHLSIASNKQDVLTYPGINAGPSSTSGAIAKVISDRGNAVGISFIGSIGATFSTSMFGSMFPCRTALGFETVTNAYGTLEDTNTTTGSPSTRPCCGFVITGVLNLPDGSVNFRRTCVALTTFRTVPWIAISS